VHHPLTPSAAEVVVELERDRVQWRIAGDVRVPSGPLDPERLWQHTCCELFVEVGEGYEEWNVSPTGQVTRFAFSSYRVRTSVARPAVDVRVSVEPRELVVEARMPVPDSCVSPTVVIEDGAGALSYWAVHHPCERPDFHDRGGFVVRLR
jgi:hypothetical protein